MMRAVEKHVPEKWIRLYIQRWLESEAVLADGTIETRNCGTPQGGVISPLLANLYLHYAFDHWMQRNHPSIPFERYADDVLSHCRSQKEAVTLLEELRGRLSDCRLELHPAKTKLAYCKDGKRRAKYAHTRFDFLGFSFHGRSVQDRRGNLFTGFNPGVSRKALKRMNQAVRDRKIHRRTSLTLQELAAILNPMVRVWVGYSWSLLPGTAAMVSGETGFEVRALGKEEVQDVTEEKAALMGMAQALSNVFSAVVCTLGLSVLIG